ncbi:MAG: hypothetical protein JSW73_04430 [Candidatus Woesearchaeota archaeon]|nr:MAG: hypothetical protein JSW73_04430 [Candidatus Woesearchaeota archaeon]
MEKVRGDIGISTTSFFYWFEDTRSNWLNRQLEVLELIKDIFITVELHFLERNIFEFNEEFMEKYSKKLSWFNKITLHLPSNFSDVVSPEEYNIANKKLNEIVERLNIEYCVMHANQYKKIDFNFTFPISIENTDPRSEDYDLIKINELEKPIVLDVDHLEEKGEGVFDEQIDLLKNKISEIHFSIPRNEYYNQFKEIITPHFLAYKSDYNIPKKIPKDKIWIIEGVIPNNRMDMLEGEVKLIEKYKN